MQSRFTAAAFLLVVALRADAGEWEALEARGARLAAVDVEVENVFDLSDPVQATWIGRLADALHVPTRAAVIRRTLTLKVGDPIDARRIHEDERNLRALRFIKDARIDARTRPDGTVAAVVRVRDAWTLKASVGYSHVGGQSSLGFDLRDRNLLGTGKDLGIRRDRGADGISTTFLYQDPQLLGSRWTLSASYQALSDGWGRSLRVGRPFFALDTPWAMSVAASTTESQLHVYDRQTVVYAAPSVATRGSVDLAWLVRLEADRALRLGLRLEAADRRYGALSVLVPPERLPAPDLAPRRLRGAALTFQGVEDGFRTFRNLQGMDTPEDYNLGWSVQGALGLYARALGSTGTGSFFNLGAAKGWAPGGQSLLLGEGAAGGRSLDGRFQGGTGHVGFTAYHWGPSWQILAANLIVDAAVRPDPEDLLYLGGQEGLRGYPNFLHAGDRRWILSLEDRFLTEWRWLGMLRAGFVVYADVGAIRRLDGSGWTRPRSDVGAGLRFGDLKSSLGRVVLLTIAFPLARRSGEDRYQILLGNAVRF